MSNETKPCVRCGLPVAKGGNSAKHSLCRDCVSVLSANEAKKWRAA